MITFDQVRTFLALSAPPSLPLLHFLLLLSSVLPSHLSFSSLLPLMLCDFQVIFYCAAYTGLPPNARNLNRTFMIIFAISHPIIHQLTTNFHCFRVMFVLNTFTSLSLTFSTFNSRVSGDIHNFRYASELKQYRLRQSVRCKTQETLVYFCVL